MVMVIVSKLLLVSIHDKIIESIESAIYFCCFQKSECGAAPLHCDHFILRLDFLKTISFFVGHHAGH